MNNSIISNHELKDIWSDPNLLILDVSPASNKAMLLTQFPDLMIKGAKLVSLKDELSDVSSSYPNTFPPLAQFNLFAKSIGLHANSKVIVYDNLGIYTSPRVWWILKTMGINDVHVLDGGLSAWVEAKGETESRAKWPRLNNGTYEGVIDTNSIKTYEDIQTSIDSPNIHVLDARTAGRFQGESPEPRVHLKSGSIPNSSNIPFKQVLNDGKLKSDQELKNLFKQFKNEDELVFSCGSGITACILHLAASKIMDSKLSVYDGSWTEWAERQKLFVNS